MLLRQFSHRSLLRPIPACSPAVPRGKNASGRRCSTGFLFGGCLLALTTGALSLQAADRTWANLGGDFNDATNWENDNLPGTNDRALFGAVDPGLRVNPNLTSSATMLRLHFGEGASGYTMSSSDAAALTLTGSGVNYAGVYTIYQNTTGENTITAPITFGATGSGTQQVVGSDGGGILNLMGSLTSAESEVVFRVADGGTVHLGGANNFAGGFRHSGHPAGIITVSHVDGLNGSGRLALGHNNAPGSILNNTSGSTISADYTEFRIDAGHATLEGGNWDFSSAIYNLTGDRVLHVESDRVTIGGVIGDYNLSKYGSGTLEIAGEALHSGETLVHAGVLLLSDVDALGEGNLKLRAASEADETGGILGLGAGDFTRSLGTGAGEVQWTYVGGRNAGGFAAYGADRFVNLGGSSEQVTWGTDGFAGRLILGAFDSDATLDFQNPIDIGGGGGDRTVQVNDGSANVDAMLSGVISGNHNFEKAGKGTLVLSAENTYTGRTRIVAGKLLVNGSIASSHTVEVLSGAALGGDGAVNAIDLQSGGVLTPGNSIGTLEGESLTWHGETEATFAQMHFELSNIDNSSDTLELGGGFLKGSGGYFLFDFQGTGTANVTYTLLTFTSTDFSVEDFGYIGLANGLTGEFLLNANSLEFSVVPEPAHIALILGGAGLVLCAVRRRRRV